MALATRLKKQALELSQKAVEKLLSDEKRAMQIASAVGSVQRGKKALDAKQADLMRALSLAPQADFKALGKRLSGLKRRIRDLEERIDALGR